MSTTTACHVISLAREPRKWAAFCERNNGTGLNFQLSPAVDGTTLTHADAVRDGLLTENATHYTPGAIGCAASHRALWKEAIRTQIPHVIFEDDVTCRRDIASRIDAFLRTRTDWDIVLLGFNTNAVLDYKLFGQSDFAGFFSNQSPTPAQLEAFSQETGEVIFPRLNNAFGACAYMVSPQGAHKLMCIFPMDNRPVHIPGNMLRFGRDVFSCMTSDMLLNTLYPHINAYVAIPPLALPLNDQTTSTTAHRG
jgi:glycosyl transferase family 25